MLNKILMSFAVLSLLIALPLRAASLKGNAQQNIPMSSPQGQLLQNIDIPVIQKIQEQVQIRTQNKGQETNIQAQDQEQNLIQTQAAPTPTTFVNINKKIPSPRSVTAHEHISIVAQKVEELLTATTTEITGIGQQIREIARIQKEVQQQIEEQFQKISNRPSWLKFIFGPAFSSIEQIKKHLEQNQLRIQKLEQLMTQLTNEGEKQTIQEMINALIQQNTALENYLNSEEQSASLLGKLIQLFSRKKVTAPIVSPIPTITPSPDSTPTTLPTPTPTE